MTDYYSSNNFCSHVGAKLLVGDVDGNGYTDLICHTPSTGWIHLDRTYFNDKFNGVDFALEPTPNLAFCRTGRVEVGDYDGDKRSDLKCVTSTGTCPVALRGRHGHILLRRRPDVRLRRRRRAAHGQLEVAALGLRALKRG